MRPPHGRSRLSPRMLGAVLGVSALLFLQSSFSLSSGATGGRPHPAAAGSPPTPPPPPPPPRPQARALDRHSEAVPLNAVRPVDRDINFTAALQPLGPQPVFPASVTAEDDIRTATSVAAWERRRVEQSRARYLRGAGKTQPESCLPPDAAQDAGDDPSAWEDRVRTPHKEVSAGMSELRALQGVTPFPEGTPDFVMPLTSEAQRAIFRNQHPADCKGASFVIWKMWNTGMGADLHTLGQALGYAMSSGRVLLLDSTEVWWYAMDRSPASLECFFVPLSNCTLADAGDAEVLTPKYRFDENYKKVLPKGRQSIRKGDPRTVANPLRLVGDIANDWATLPRPEWKQWGYQWWMSQTSRYLLRRQQPWFKQVYKGWVEATFGEGGPPAKLLGVHVRHGDKHKEMRLLPLAMYMEKAEAMRKAEPELQSIFLSTEDDAVLAESAKYTPRWKFYWTKHLRSNTGSPMDYAMLVGPSKLAEISFVNLLIQEQHCTHWIGTDQSNWNRLINELRMTAGGFARPYVQLNRKACPHKATPSETRGVVVPGWQKGC